MIISKTPFRISFCGGGSDLPAFYKIHEGCVISSTIDKYIYLSIQKSFHGNIVLKYSKTEKVNDVQQIKHKIFNKCLSLDNVSGVEIVSMADIPKGTGMGSSSSFTVGLLNLINFYKNNNILSKKDLAERACKIECELTQNNIGKQDQYAAAFGGLNYIVFKKNGDVVVSKLELDTSSLQMLNDNLFVYYIGGTHDAKEILKDQSSNIMNDKSKIKCLIEMCNITKKLKKELIDGNIDFMGEALHQNWVLKKSLSSKISSRKIDFIYEYALNNGATGGKVLGAGGCGFMLFYVPQKNHKNFIEKMRKYKRFDFKFEQKGSQCFEI